MGKIEESRYCSPLRYPGGKACIYNFVSNFFYENELVGTCYAEPYAGGAGLALRLLFDEYVKHIFINDFDKSIYTFWKVILEDNERFCNWVSTVDISVDNWFYYKNIQNNSHLASEFDLAKSTFFLNRTNVSGVIKGGIIGGIKQTGKYKIDARFNRQDLIMRIKKIAKFKNRITVTNLDGLDFIARMNRKKENVFIYIDPPYVQKGADLYMNFYSKNDHEKLSKKIHKMNLRWMVSYDNNDFILNLYNDRRKVIYKLSQAASNRVGDEVLIFSEELDFKNSIKKLQSPICVE
jgi:DNA adenine methylase